jgi:hypothetical protein
MKTAKILASTVIAVASMAATGAFAQSQGPVSVAQVRAELAQARADGSASITTNERANPVAVNTGMQKSRADVKAELAQAEASSEWDNPSERLNFEFDKTVSTKSRADVNAEVLKAKATGAMANPGTARVPYGTTGRS